MPGVVVSFSLVLFAVGCSSWQGARLYKSGTEALSRGEPDRAIADLEAAAVLVPLGSEIQNHLGLAYSDRGRAADALAAFERAVALDCGNLAARENLIVARWRSDRAVSPGRSTQRAVIPKRAIEAAAEDEVCDEP